MVSKKGPRAVYRPKDPPATTVSLTFLSKQILRAAAERGDTSVSEVVDHLARKHGGEVRREDFAPLEAVVA